MVIRHPLVEDHYKNITAIDTQNSLSSPVLPHQSSKLTETPECVNLKYQYSY